MGVKKILVELLEENQQLKKDAERYQTLFLDMEQKVWELEDSLKELRAYPKKPEIGEVAKPADLRRLVIEELSDHPDDNVRHAAQDLGDALGLWPSEDDEGTHIPGGPDDREEGEPKRTTTPWSEVKAMRKATEIKASMNIDAPNNPSHTKAEEPIAELDCGD